MNKLLFGAATAAMLVAASPAFAVDGDCMGGMCGNERYDILVAPIVQCHFVRQRITTRRGHVIYRSRQVCG
jgi:hypothetical protein